MLHTILFLLYLAVLILATILARLNGHRPITLALTAVPALAAIYAVATRLYRLLTGQNDAAAVYDQVGTIVYWALVALILAYAVALTRRIANWRGFVGPDGRRWRVRKARVPGDGEIPVARPSAGRERMPPLVE